MSSKRSTIAHTDKERERDKTRERARERENERGREGERQREREGASAVESFFLFYTQLFRGVIHPI
jgi:hypothetical protein